MADRFLPVEKTPATRGMRAGYPLASPLMDFGASRRVGHGGVSWTLRSQNPLRQPQDGAGAAVERGTAISLEAHLLAEPEDARLNGSTRSLTRRLLGLNMTSREATPSRRGAKSAEPARLSAEPAAPRPKVA